MGHGYWVLIYTLVPLVKIRTFDCLTQPNPLKPYQTIYTASWGTPLAAKCSLNLQHSVRNTVQDLCNDQAFDVSCLFMS